MFEIIEKIEDKKAINLLGMLLLSDKTLHSKTREKRHDVYSKLFNDNTKFIGCFVVNKNHKNGLEYHFIFNNRVTLIFNKNSKQYITCLYLRDKQINRYIYKDMRLNDLDFEKFIFGYNNI